MTVAALPKFRVELAKSPEDLLEAQRLRYDVFVAELGATGAGVDHSARLERDRFDGFAEHLLLRDISRPERTQVIGTYRLLDEQAAEKAGGFYSHAEFDLAPLRNSGRKLLELGRSCLHAEYRGGKALSALWGGLAEHVVEREVDVLFGVASFGTTDPKDIAAPLSHLHHSYLAPETLRVMSRRPAVFETMPPEQIDRLAAMRDTPALIKAYLRLGGLIGQGAYVDHAFNTTDICMILDTQMLKSDSAAVFLRKDASE